MKIIYISLQLLMWVYRKTDFMISTILCYIFHCNCTKVSFVKDYFSKILWSSASFPILWPLALISVIRYHCTWKKFLMVVIHISVNHIFHLTASTIKPLIEVLPVWMKTFWLVLFLLSQYIGSGSST